MSNINNVTALKAITDIIIDEEAFDRSVRQLEELVSDIKKLEKDVDDMLAYLIQHSFRKEIYKCLPVLCCGSVSTTGYSNHSGHEKPSTGKKRLPERV